MANFAYTVRTKDGAILKGIYEASDKVTVVTGLKGKGYIPLKIKEKTGLNQDVKLSMLNKKVSLKDISIFCRQFSAVIDAGIPILECLDIVRKQTESLKMRSLLNSVYEQVQKGKSLSESMNEFKGQVPPMMINMVEAGEASGTLDKVMARLATYFANKNRIKSKAISATVYPIFIFVFTILAVIALVTFVIPQFKDMYGSMGVDLPGITQMMLDISAFITNNTFLLLILVAGLIGGFIYFINSTKGKVFFDRLFLRAPIVSGVFKKIISATYTRTLASLLSAGVPLIQSLEITDKVINNTVVSKYLEKVREDITKGSRLSTAIGNVKVFPSMVVSMTNIGEESGSLDLIMDKTADFFEEESEAAIERAATMIEPIAIAFMAVIVGVVVISIVMPMANSISSVQSMG